MGVSALLAHSLRWLFGDARAGVGVCVRECVRVSSDDIAASRIAACPPT